MKGSVDDRMIRKIIRRCNVYPKQSPSDIKEHVRKAALLTEKELESSPSRRRLIKRTSEAMDLKSRIENDDWIKFEKDPIELDDKR